MISVVIPSYNRKDSVLALLGDVFLQEGTEFEVIVVDDCSPDGSADAIAAAFPQATLLRNSKNGGPCVTRNRGIREAKGDYIVGFDSDVRIADPTLLARTLETFRKMPPNVHCLAFRLLQADGVSEDKARWWHPVPIEQYADEAFETSYFSGTGYAMNREAALAAGLYPEILYMHYEEVELAWRLIDNGGVIMHCPNLKVLHLEHQVSRRSEIKVFYKTRNQILLAAACLPLFEASLFVAPRVSYAALRAIMGGHVPSYLRALRSSLQLAPQRLRNRTPLSRETLRRISLMRK